MSDASLYQLLAVGQKLSVTVPIDLAPDDLSSSHEASESLSSRASSETPVASVFGKEYFDTYIKELRPEQPQGADTLMLLVDPPSVRQLNLYRAVKPGLEVMVMAIGPQGLIEFPATVSSYQNTGLVGYWMAVAAQADYEKVQRRDHFRVPILVNLQARVLPPETPSENQTEAGPTLPAVTLNGQGLDISAGGMKVSLKTGTTLLKPAQRLQITFQLADKEPALTLEAVVISARPSKIKTTDSHSLYGLKFVDVPAAQQAYLMRMCFQLQVKKQ